MIKYKVTFENNKAIAARQIDFSNYDCVRIEYPEGKSVIRWLVVYASDEQESVNVANTIVKGIGFQNYGKQGNMEIAAI